jgi:hypothetical protein
LRIELLNAGDLCQLENLLMMCSFAKRYGQGEDNAYARKAVKALNDAKDQYLRARPTLFDSTPAAEGGECT